MENNRNISAVVLAAGRGTRMNSAIPKVLHEIFQKPLLGWVLNSIKELSEKKNVVKIIVVAGFGADCVREYLNKNHKDTSVVIQKEQLGTAHAVCQTLPELEGFEGDVLIVCGDTPLITSKTLYNFIDFHQKNASKLTIMTTLLNNPFGYGRIVRDNFNNIVEIVEQKDADDIQKQIKEINTGIYLLDWKTVSKILSEIKNENAQGEYYLTDIVKQANEKKLKVLGFITKDNTEMYGINSRRDLANAVKIMKDRKLGELMEKGVGIADINSTFISPETTIEKDTIIYPNTCIEGKNIIGKNCKIGPMTHIRGNCEIGEHCKIGNFVELKNAKISDNTNVCHLSYLGDAELGKNVNIGAGTIFANYNSITKEKNKSVLKNGVSIGSNSVIVAPVEIGENAFVAGLSCITKNVEEESLAITRTQQKEIKNWVKNKKENG